MEIAVEKEPRPSSSELRNPELKSPEQFAKEEKEIWDKIYHERQRRMFPDNIEGERTNEDSRVIVL